MTLNTTYKPAVAQGNGIIKEFSYSFNPLSLSYIKVYFEVDGKWVEQKTGWSATFSDSGGVVTFLTAPTTRVSIERDVPESQPTSYTTSSGFQAKVIENSFDLLTGMVQELKDASDRSVKVEVGDNQTPEELLEEVYNKLDSATEIAGDAINAANQAQTAADNATAAVNQAEQTLTEVTNYVDLAKTDIENTKNTAISTIDSTVAQAKSDINTAVSNAESNISAIVSDAEGSIANIAVTEANKAIANAAQEATDTAKANLNSYVDGTVKPSLQTYVDQAQTDANSAATSMEQAALSATSASNYASNASASETNALSSKNAAASSATAASGSANNAKIWAEGTDSEVQALGGVHSSKVWAAESSKAQAQADWNQADDTQKDYIKNKPTKLSQFTNDIDTLPDQTGNADKFLKTDGTTASWNNAVDYTNITNCITKIPQDIKLELKDGTLTLKAGSKVYAPNGFESNGTTPKFDVVVIETDTTVITSSSTGNYIILYKNGSFRNQRIGNCYSGATAPTISEKYAAWYDTTNNIIKLTNDTGATWVADSWSFPICLTKTTDGVLDSVDQVFNGFGYIGSTVFALPGVKGLIPNGRNADGSLKNIEFTTSRVLTSVVSGSASVNLLINQIGYYSSNNTFNYDSDDNFNYQNNKRLFYCDGGFISIANGVITSFAPKTAFHAVDYNDRETVVGWGMPDYSAGIAVSFSVNVHWTAPSDGILILASEGGTAPAYYGLINETVRFRTSASLNAGGQGGLIILSKNDTVKMDTITVATQQNTFVPFKGVN